MLNASMSVPSVLPVINTPTFDTLWEDIQRAGDSSTPMITESEIARSALLPAVDPDTDMAPGPPSPLSDTGFSQLINLEAAAWAIELTDAGYNPLSISPPNPSSGQFQRPDLILGAPAIYHKLCAAGAPFWAAVSLDIQHCLWAKLSQKLSGREPSKTQFLDTYTEAISRQATFCSTWVAGKLYIFCNSFCYPQIFQVKVILDVPRIANQEVSRDTMMGNALQTKNLLHVVEAEVTTTPTNAKFMLALILTVSTLPCKCHPS